jgi:hypothetical protein
MKLSFLYENLIHSHVLEVCCTRTGSVLIFIFLKPISVVELRIALLRRLVQMESGLPYKDNILTIESYLPKLHMKADYLKLQPLRLKFL